MERDAVIVAGFGFRAAAGVDSLLDAYRLASAGRNADLVATAADKAQAAAFVALAETLGRPAAGVPGAAIAAQDTATGSAASQRARGTGSLAEAAALAAAGPGARLLAPRAVSRDRLATCALAIGDAT